MTVEIITKPIIIDIHGFSSVAVNKDFAKTAFKLMDRMWQVVKHEGLKNKGLNIWVYEDGDRVFAGVELESPPPDLTLERKTITLSGYGYYKHIGPYQQIPAAGERMNQELKEKGFEPALPYVEIYGHWTQDENKLVTELLTSLQ